MKKVCDVCSVEFETRTRAAIRERFCSRKCYKKFWNDKLSLERRVVADLARVCVVCSKHFVADKHHPKAVTCSLKCSHERANRIRAERRSAVRDVAPRNCALCGTEFLPNKFAPGKKYCSARCTGLVASRAYYVRKGTAANTERARKYRAGGNWVEAVQKSKRKCEICGSVEKLHVHHRDGTGEDEAANHQVENLAILCHSCHSQVHRIKYRIVDGKFYVFGLVFDWLKIKRVKVMQCQA